MRLLAYQLNFLSVFAISSELTVYLGAWSAQERVARRRYNAIVARDAQLLLWNFTMTFAGTMAGGSVSMVQPQPEIEKEWWEKATLVLCSLH